MGLFATSEFLYRIRQWDVENTRKVAHAGAGLLSLSFPFLFEKVGYVAIICGAFLVILAVTKRLRLMPSIHAVKRVTYGSTMFPLVVCICFWVYSLDRDLAKFYLPVLVMGLADPAACLVGRRYPIRKLVLKKSLGGSLAFWAVALVLSIGVGCFLKPNTDWSAVLFTSIAVASVSTVAEAVSQKGMDNLTIPLSVLAVLYFM